MSPATPRLSVIVPAYQGERLLPDTLAALAGSDLPREQWELVVVDDSSTDRTAEVARPWADRVIRLTGGPRGPAAARNEGAALSHGEWLAFVDADVRVHPDTLRRMLEATAGPRNLVAIFGAYDEAPPAPGFISQFRNLLHRYVHLRGAGEAATFWAGCGAVRRDAFEEVGGFDATRFPRPQIEDIDLGYRLRDRGGRIRIHPEIQGAHLKRWTFLGGFRTDLWDRGIPWIRLLHARGGLGGDSSLNLQGGERLKTTLVGLGLAALGLSPWAGPWCAALGAGLLASVVVLNAPVLRWFAAQRGAWFAMRAAAMMLVYHLVSGLAVIVGTVAHLRGPGFDAPAGPSRLEPAGAPAPRRR